MAERAGAYPQQLQVVNMACGLDSRAFRLCFPTNTTLWEVDRQEVRPLACRFAHTRLCL
jgi:O-methyltransferase involved in polyketide biosynthesis